MSELLADGTKLNLLDWLLPWRARKIIRFYAAAMSIEKTKLAVEKAMICMGDKEMTYKEFVEQAKRKPCE
jgi:hypothetical protein